MKNAREHLLTYDIALNDKGYFLLLLLMQCFHHMTFFKVISISTLLCCFFQWLQIYW